MTVRYVAVAGPGDASRRETDAARDVGALLAERGHIVVCGGLGGVMAAAAEGARRAGGVVIGLLPGVDRSAGNPHLTYALPTGLGQARNALVVAAADALIAVGGGWGTLSEIALAARNGKPVVLLESWDAVPPSATDGEPPVRVSTAHEAVEEITRRLRRTT